MTPGFSPADLENVLNEAALLTARRDGKTIMMEELEEAVTKVMAGPAKKSRVVTEKERKLTAYHEAGHAVLIRNAAKFRSCASGHDYSERYGRRYDDVSAAGGPEL